MFQNQSRDARLWNPPSYHATLAVAWLILLVFSRCWVADGGLLPHLPSLQPHSPIRSRWPSSIHVTNARVRDDEPNLVSLQTSDDYFHQGTRVYHQWYQQADKNSTASLPKSALLFQSAIDLEEAQLLSEEEKQPNCDNLLVALRALATVYASSNDSTKCLRVIDEIRFWKSCKMPFAIEEHWSKDNTNINDTQWEWISAANELECDPQNKKVALRTKGEPWLDKSAIIEIQEAAKHFRESASATGQKSTSTRSSTRFTMQYAGNSDLHVADLVLHKPDLQNVFDELLQSHVYPFVRREFLSPKTNEKSHLLPLCVYDALIVRYDGDAATQQGRATGASLPLHRDGGLFSVNIALQGDGSGGTMFDRLLLGRHHHHHTPNMIEEVVQNAIIRPHAPGYAVIHRSTERHAGAPTKSGVREILVVFLTQRPDRGSDGDSANIKSFAQERAVERAFYLKELAGGQQLLPISETTISNLYKWAVEENPMDGEALFWVGHSQIQKAKRESQELLSHGRHVTFNGLTARDSIWKDLQSGIANLEKVANELDPCNVRTLAYLGSAYSIRWGFALETQPETFGLHEEEELKRAASVLKRALHLTNAFEVVFGDNTARLGKATLLLQLGEVLLQQGFFHEAELCLGQVPEATKSIPETLSLDLRSAANDMLEACASE